MFGTEHFDIGMFMLDIKHFEIRSSMLGVVTGIGRLVRLYDKFGC